MMMAKTENAQFPGNFDEELAEVAARLRAARKAKGYTQKELGDRADTSGSYISDLENCAVNPSIVTLFRLAEALDLEVSTLFNGIGRRQD